MTFIIIIFMIWGFWRLCKEKDKEKLSVLADNLDSENCNYNPVKSTESINLMWDDYIGQDNAKKLIRSLIDDMKLKKQYDLHLLLTGRSGAGKTTLAKIIANDLSLPLVVLNGASLNNIYDCIIPIINAQMVNDKKINSCVVFIDEIHSVDKKIMTQLLTFLTDYELGSFKANPFIMIGATTEVGKLSYGDLAPFKRRFITIDLQQYSRKEIIDIIASNTRNNYSELSIDLGDICCIADNSRNEAGRAINMLKLFNKTKNMSTVLNGIGIIENGISKQDIEYLSILFNSKNLKNEHTSVGLMTLSVALGLSKEQIEYDIEPYLIKLNLINRTSKGRIITELGKQYYENYKKFI